MTGGSARRRTDLQRGRQDAQAVQTLVELRVVSPAQEGLAELRLTSALRGTAEGANSALLARPEEVTQGRALAAAFTDTKTGTGKRVQPADLEGPVRDFFTFWRQMLDFYFTNDTGLDLQNHQRRAFLQTMNTRRITG